MRFLQLHLRAFGAFDAPAPLEFPSPGGPGLSVVYGENEAGKTTLLRGIRALLYGIPAQSVDGFVHGYGALRIAARLRFDDGEEIAFTRRKRNKDPIFDHDDEEPIAVPQLARLAAAVPESMFERFYGLDPEELRRGVRALRADDGEVGRALYGASLGVSDTRAVLEGLEAEADQIFLPRASKPRLNQAVGLFESTAKALKQEQLDPDVWADLTERVRQRAEHVTELEHALREERTRAAGLDRVTSALPLLARRRGIRSRMEARGEVPALPDDFAEQVERLRASRQTAVQQRRDASDRMNRHEGERAALVPDEEILATREVIEDLHAGLGRVRETLDQLPRREEQRSGLDATIDMLLGADAELTPDRMAGLREAYAQAAPIRERAAQGERCLERARAALEAEEEAEAELERARATTEAGVKARSFEPDAVSRLEAATVSARELGAIDQRVEELEAQCASFDAELEVERARLGLAGYGLDEIESLACPAPDWIDTMTSRFGDQEASRARNTEQLEKLRGEKRNVVGRLDTLRAEGSVPRIEDLAIEREARDVAWQRVRSGLLEDPSRLGSEERRVAVDDFEERIAGADDVADRLRADAARVAEQAAGETAERRLTGELEEYTSRATELVAAGVLLENEWSAAWESTGVEPRTPVEMRGWRRDFDEHVKKLGARRDLLRRVDIERSTRDAASDRLVAVLRKLPGGEVSATRLSERVEAAEAWVVRAREELDSLERAREAESAAAASHARAMRDRERADRAVGDWRQGWASTLDLLRLPTEASPGEANARLDAIGQLVERLREREQLEGRITKMRADVDAFEARAAAVVERSAPVLVGRPVTEQVVALHRALGASLEQQTLLGKAEAAIVEAREDRDKAAARLAHGDEALAALCKVASVEDDAGLDDAIRRWTELQHDRTRLAEIEDDLAELAGGRSIEEFAEEAEQHDTDSLAATAAEVDERMERLTGELREASEEHRSDRDRLEALDGSARAAELAMQAESQLAAVRREAQRFVELRLASRILSEEIDRYRRENEAPLLRRASRILDGLTHGRWVRVETDVDLAKGAVHLVAVAKEGVEKTVEGLSKGTRDQLFLALRLATLEQSLEGAETMPFIADDLLVEFDDARSTAALEVLAELGQHTQVLLLTHHSRVAEQARSLGDRAHVIEI